MSDLGNKEIMAKNIRHYMGTFNVTQTEICNTLGIKMPTFSDWVNAKTYPRIDKIELMANYFGISKADLVEEHDSLSKKDKRDIKKDLDSIMGKLTNQESGPAAYDGEALDPEAAELFREELEIALKRLKIINKEKYNPYKNKK